MMCTKGELSAKSQEQRLRNYDPANNLASKVTIAVYIYFLFSLTAFAYCFGWDWSNGLVKDASGKTPRPAFYIINAKGYLPQYRSGRW